jgi:DMSO/TMAO reductase YedYZ molybdopterin-dependent catalytic subunit
MSSKDQNKKRGGLPPGQKPIKRLLSWGKNHPSISPIPKMELGKWTLTIDGDVEHPLRLSWDGLLKLPKVHSVSDFHCVEGWSVLNCNWEGVAFRYIVDLIKPRDTARFVIFECADGYTTSLPIKELLGKDVLLAYRLNGEDLEEGFGGPLRLVVPSKYAYKSAMWVKRIRLVSENELGYWESRGYSDTADVWSNDRLS